ncbi:MAG: hypothetical protein O9350_25145 [Microcystis sp. LE19-388.1G]|nr:hypothetical protein [Microcystis sp. LE19-388.1G]
MRVAGGDGVMGKWGSGVVGWWGSGSQSIRTTIFHREFKCSTTEKTNNKPPEFVLG